MKEEIISAVLVIVTAIWMMFIAMFIIVTIFQISYNVGKRRTNNTIKDNLPKIIFSFWNSTVLASI